MESASPRQPDSNADNRAQRRGRRVDNCWLISVRRLRHQTLWLPRTVGSHTRGVVRTSADAHTVLRFADVEIDGTADGGSVRQTSDDARQYNLLVYFLQTRTVR